MRDAETLLLVDDQQAEIVESDVFRQQPMGADDDVDLARLRSARTSFCSALLRKRLSISICTGKAAKRCWSVS